MKTLMIGLIGASAAVLSAPAAAQDMPETAPDGTRAFTLEPYAGVQGGYHEFDSSNGGRITTNCNGGSGCPDGGLVEGFAGVNAGLGPVFLGVEGNIAKGFKGLDYEYGVYGRFGGRAGESGLIYGKVGYQWVRTKVRDTVNGGRRRDDAIAWGLGVEAGPKDIGLDGLIGQAGVRLRAEVTTFNFQSLRPVAGVVFHF